MSAVYSIAVATETDLDKWMRLATLMRDNFPGLEAQAGLEEHRCTVARFMARGTALCARLGSTLAGVLLFSPNRRLLCFMAVHPDHRRQGIATALIGHMLALMPEGDVTVSTFCAEDPRGTAPRALYQRLGFVPGALGEEFGCLQQQFVLTQAARRQGF